VIALGLAASLIAIVIIAGFALLERIEANHGVTTFRVF
jgi:hypothetical protein